MSEVNVHVEFGICSLKSRAMTPEEEEQLQKEAGIRSGYLYFDDHRLTSQHIPFLFAPAMIDTEAVVRMLFEDWHLPPPRLILLALAETEDSPSEVYRNISRKLVTGLIHIFNTTEMWLCTNGLSQGFSKDVGKAFQNEASRRKTVESSMKSANTAFPETALIGICDKDDVVFSHRFKKTTLESGIKKPKARRNIDKSYGRFIFVDDTSEEGKGMFQFLINFGRHLSKHKQPKMKIEDSSTLLTFGETPVIILLIHGKITQADLVLGYLKQGLPLIVFEGSGGLADLLAYAYYAAESRPEAIIEAEFFEAVLKPDVVNIMHISYPSLTEFEICASAEKIINCLRYFKQQDQEFITILNINNIDLHHVRFPSLLLKALFRSKPLEALKDMNQMKRDLLLAIDWNTPDVAKDLIFSRDVSKKLVIDSEMFFLALIKPQREEFVSLFLDEGFIVHTFLDSAYLAALFQNSLSKEFFKAVVWESVLGFGTNVEITRSFLDSRLIILIEEFTAIPSLINSYELDWNHQEIYDDRTAEEAERKAMAVLAIWAILSHRIDLVKTLWKHSEQPIHVALTSCIILKKLQPFVSDLSLQHEMQKQSKEFSKMAAEVMTLCYERVPCRALDLLNEKNRVWSYKALLELAAFSENKMFIAHPCCQEHLDNIFMAYIKMRDLPYGDITIPLWLKTLLCAFLVFPMYLWARFELPPTAESSDKGTSKENASVKKSKSSTNDMSTEDMSKEDIKQSSSTPRMQPEADLSLRQKIFHFWCAPITKFWVSQVFYFLFLVCFSTAVLWPACGNVFLDFFTCLWLAIIIIDSIYHAYTLSVKYTSMPLGFTWFEIGLMTLFLLCYAFGRILWKYTFMTPYNAKVMLCFALLYFYYRLIFIALPISSDLGPMLYRVKRMVVVDFLSYIRVTALILICNGIVIHATIYPDYPLNWELARRAFFDTMTSFFLTPAEHFGVADPKCIRLKRDWNQKSFIGVPEMDCKVGRYLKDTCPNPGVWPYIYGLQFLMLLKLIFGVMLFALFSNTARILEEEGKYIWKYQRYALVINFSNRLFLPPPFSILILIYKLVKYMQALIRYYLLKYVAKTSKDKYEWSRKETSQEELDENDFRYWRQLALEHSEQKVQEEAEEMTIQKRMDRINALMDALNHQKRTVAQLLGHLQELQIEITISHQYLEDSGLELSIEEKFHELDVPQKLSRTSPYPGTVISRFPVSENHVPWTCIWISYDPISFTQPTEVYPVNMREQVDYDVQKARENYGESFQMPHFNWNQTALSPGGILFDRKSWIVDKSGKTVEYELDCERLPKNPRGRTGLRGRGCLAKWGPNHYTYVMITRWSEEFAASKKKYLDIILMNKDGDLSLPGGYVLTENRYESIRNLFQSEGAWPDSGAMVAFFESLKGPPGWRQSMREALKTDEIVPFTHERVLLGYLDEATNTDQAWCEAEIWHFHYNTPCSVEDKIRARLEWHVLSEEKLKKVPIGQAAIIFKTAKGMEATLEPFEF